MDIEWGMRHHFVAAITKSIRIFSPKEILEVRNVTPGEISPTHCEPVIVRDLKCDVDKVLANVVRWSLSIENTLASRIFRIGTVKLPTPPFLNALYPILRLPSKQRINCVFIVALVK